MLARSRAPLCAPSRLRPWLFTSSCVTPILSWSASATVTRSSMRSTRSLIAPTLDSSPTVTLRATSGAQPRASHRLPPSAQSLRCLRLPRVQIPSACHCPTPPGGLGAQRCTDNVVPLPTVFVGTTSCHPPSVAACSSRSLMRHAIVSTCGVSACLVAPNPNGGLAPESPTLHGRANGVGDNVVVLALCEHRSVIDVRRANSIDIVRIRGTCCLAYSPPRIPTRNMLGVSWFAGPRAKHQKSRY